MDWSSVFYAALGGGGGALLGNILAIFIQKLRSKSTTVDKNDTLGAGIRGGFAGGLAVLGMTVLPSLYKNMTLPRIIPFDFSDIEEDVPIYGIIKEQSPKDYDRLIAPVDEAIRNNNFTQNNLDEMRVVLFKLMAEKMNFASADTLREMEKQSIRQQQIYKEKKPTICTLTINGEPFPPLTDILSDDDVLREQKLMVKLFTDPPRDSKIVPNLDQGKETFDEIISSSLNELNITNLQPEISEDLANDPQNISEHQKICDFAVLVSTKKIGLSNPDLINFQYYLTSLE